MDNIWKYRDTALLSDVASKLILKSANRKHCKTLSQNGPKNRLFKRFFYVRIWIAALYAIYVRRKSTHLQICESFKSANYKKALVRKSGNCHICGKSANRTYYTSPQGCGFAICGIYLRTAHLCLFHITYDDTRN